MPSTTSDRPQMDWELPRIARAPESSAEWAPRTNWNDGLQPDQITVHQGTAPAIVPNHSGHRPVVWHNWSRQLAVGPPGTTHAQLEQEFAHMRDDEVAAHNAATAHFKHQYNFGPEHFDPAYGVVTPQNGLQWLGSEGYDVDDNLHERAEGPVIHSVLGTHPAQDDDVPGACQTCGGTGMNMEERYYHTALGGCPDCNGTGRERGGDDWAIPTQSSHEAGFGDMVRRFINPQQAYMSEVERELAVLTDRLPYITGPTRPAVEARIENLRRRLQAPGAIDPAQDQQAAPESDNMWNEFWHSHEAAWTWEPDDQDELPHGFMPTPDAIPFRSPHGEIKACPNCGRTVRFAMGMCPLCGYDEEAGGVPVQPTWQSKQSGPMDRLRNFVAPPFRPQTQPTNAPTPGQMCYFHPDRPAVAAEGFAPMCQECLERYRQAQQGVGHAEGWQL